MSITAALLAPPLTLDQLAALSDEIAALARAGVPLDRGLAALSRDLPGRLGKIAEELGQKLAAGQPLDRAVADDLGRRLPPAYQAVITAGLRAGRLPAALEGIASTARRISQLRTAIGLSLIYPVVVLALSWILCLFVLVKLAPVTAKMMAEFDVTSLPLSEYVNRLIATVWYWAPVVPLAFALWLLIAWYRSGRVALGVELHPLLAFGAVGTLSRMQRAGRMASLADLLGLLITSDVPLADAVELASQACGSAPLARGGKQFAEQLRRGERIDKTPEGFSPLLAWTLAAGQSQAQLLRSLDRSAHVYRDEFQRREQWLAIYVPLFLTIGVGGSVAFVYAIVTLGPWVAIMQRLAQPF